MARRGQAGLTIVELMVAMVISLLLLAGLITVFASMRTSFRTTRQLNQLVDQQRLASTVLSDSLSNAGYYPVTNRTIVGKYPKPALAFPVASTSLTLGNTSSSIKFDTAGQVIYGTGGTTAGSQDIIAVRMLTDGGKGPLDCHGNQPKPSTIAHVLSVVWINSNNRLECTIKRDTPAGAGTATSSPLVGGQLIPGGGNQFNGVTSLIATYGVDTTGDGSVNRYMSAATLNSAGGDKCLDPATGQGHSSSCWPYVRNVRLAIGFVSGLKAGKTFTLHRTITLENAMGRNVEAK